MANTDRDLFDTLRARGLRKSAANNLAKAFGRADKSPPGHGARRAVSELRSLVEDLEDRARGGPAKRKAAAKKAAATRRRKAKARSEAAKKAARTRSRSASSRSTSRSRSKCALQGAEPKPSSDLQRAIQFERYKDRAAALQARKEARNPSVRYGEANREANPQPGMADPGEPQWQKEKANSSGSDPRR